MTCVIPSEAEGPRIFYDTWNMHPNHASSDVFGARSVAEGESARVQKDPGSLGFARDDTMKEPSYSLPSKCCETRTGSD